jgi:hypothetical protein
MYNPSHNDEALLRLVAQVKQTIHEATAALARRLPTDPRVARRDWIPVTNKMGFVDKGDWPGRPR